VKRNSIDPAHLKAGSALTEFLAGRLGAPGCWPNEHHGTSHFPSVLDERSSIQRWENEGGKTVPMGTPAEDPSFALPHFHPTRPLLTQLI
jgi:hypothetical protein